MLRILFFLAFVFSATSTSAPFIKPCKNRDTDCVLQSSKAAFPVLVVGVPELGVKSLDPMKLPLVTSDEGGLKITFTNSTLTGLKNCVLDGVKSDLDKMKHTVNLKCSVLLKGNYKLSGQLLILPVQGEGKYKIDIKDIALKVVVDIMAKTGVDGKQHWHINKWNHSYQVKTSVRFMFDNLFNGNNALAAPVTEFANSNWKEVMQEIAPPIIRAIMSEGIASLEAFYAAVPSEELFIP